MELRSYDKRGNPEWTSIPLSWAASAAGTTTATERAASYSYDALNRPIQTTYADGAIETVGYTHKPATLFGTNVTVPAIHTQDAQCHDAAAANTLCMERWDLADHAGRRIRSDMQDAALSDVGATASDRSTNYTFDLLGRLTQVVDPKGITFDYTYDVYGNRTQASDPGLGIWTMEYDLNNNLVKQTDAKGEEITFNYDALNRVTLKTVGNDSTRVRTYYDYDQISSGYYNKGRLDQDADLDQCRRVLPHPLGRLR